MPIETIKMIRGIRDQQYEETRDMTTEQKILYFQNQSDKFRKRLAIHSKNKSKLVNTGISNN